MKNFFLISLFFMIIYPAFSAMLEFQGGNVLFGGIYIYTDDNGNKISSYILDPDWGTVSKTLKNILKKYPEVWHTFNTGNATLWGGALITGIGLGCALGSPLWGMLYHYEVMEGISWKEYMIQEKFGFLFPVFLFGGLGISCSIVGFIMLFLYYKWFEKSFKMFNELESGERKVSLDFYSDFSSDKLIMGGIIRL